jgi:hypothetical protein
VQGSRHHVWAMGMDGLKARAMHGKQKGTLPPPLGPPHQEAGSSSWQPWRFRLFSRYLLPPFLPPHMHVCWCVSPFTPPHPLPLTPTFPLASSLLAGNDVRLRCRWDDEELAPVVCPKFGWWCSAVRYLRNCIRGRTSDRCILSRTVERHARPEDRRLHLRVRFRDWVRYVCRCHHSSGADRLSRTGAVLVLGPKFAKRC